MTPSILLVDDDADDAEMTMHALGKANLVGQLIHIDDGAQALEYLFACDVDPALLLLDLKMPKVDGVQILTKLKSNAEKRHVPVIALISSSNGKDYVESFGVKADGYLLKPVAVGKFVEMIRNMGLSGLIAESASSFRSMISIL